MKAFKYRDEIYIRVIPAKTLFNSTLIHETVNRGNIFAVRVSDSKLTIVPGNATVEHLPDLHYQEANQKVFNYD